MPDVSARQQLQEETSHWLNEFICVDFLCMEVFEMMLAKAINAVGTHLDCLLGDGDLCFKDFGHGGFTCTVHASPGCGLWTCQLGICFVLMI